MSAIAVDAGTSMIKAVVFGDDGRAVAVARQATDVRRPRPAWAEQDMAAVWHAVVAAVREVLPHAPAAVRFVAVTAQGDGCWPVDDHGEPTGPAILWSDGRGAAVVEAWHRSGIAEQAFRVNGSLGFAGLPHAVLTWLREHDPDRLARSSAVLTCGGWLFSRCTGLIGIDSSDASVPFLDPRTRAYSPRLLSLFGLEWAAGLLPPIRDGAARSAPLTERAAAEFGLPAGTPVVLAPYDVAATALGVGATAPGQACTILGTTLCTEVVRSGVDTSGEPSGLTIVLDAAAHDPGTGERGPGAPVLRAFPTLAGTEVLDWASAVLGLAHPREVVTLAGQAPPGANGVSFLPYLSPAGERAPFLDTRARGTFWGLCLEHGRAEVARAVLEGLSLVIRDCVLAAGAGATELRVCGGGANSEAWCALVADVVGVPVVRPADAEVGAKGAFLTGLVATGAEPSITAAAARYVHIDRSYEPDPHRAERYAAAYEHFLALREISARGWRVPAGRDPA
ncbi:xylulokinase [Prauserella shujinwangii]|uniref:Xylulokinase n=1 Tax=Prauserella shujinwangii TaxID=1453103 RepID=A0A2T0LTT8_9PSEU|nr:FGGY family carbohydrate kinase [Prauserella shujinwangii]PRX47158.1 xylulokinase [Prauserella shujinwangii]